MAIKIRFPYNTTAAATPTASNLIVGEIAINTADGKIYVKDTTTVKQLIGPTGPAGPSGSDYRIKNSISPLEKSLERVSNLNPVKFAFNDDPANTIVDGFIAHEVQSIVPEAVTGVKDGDKIQTLDPTKLIPVMVGAIQELKQIIDEIKNGH